MLVSQTFSRVFAVALTACLPQYLQGQNLKPSEPNPPKWPSSVQVFGPENSTEDIEATVNQAFAQNGGHDPANHGQFSTQRHRQRLRHRHQARAATSGTRCSVRIARCIAQAINAAKMVRHALRLSIATTCAPTPRRWIAPSSLKMCQ